MAGYGDEDYPDDDDYICDPDVDHWFDKVILWPGNPLLPRPEQLTLF